MKPVTKTFLPTDWGNFIVYAYGNENNEGMPHFALVAEGFDPSITTTIRIHSECITGDVFKSKRCDCGEQLNIALQKIAEQAGVLLYMRQEGRGIGIINKLNAYNLQDKGLNTYEANIHLGLEADGRQYHEAIVILKDLQVTEINLLTNNPKKIDAFINSGIIIKKRLSLTTLPKEENKLYLNTKKNVMGHLLDNL
jgi:GTP cyclohydrolase II